MSNMKHTPGPWYVVFGKNISVGPMPGQRVALCNYDNGPVEKANARLIAAAPELLEALGRLFAMGINTELRDICGSEWVDDARAAITKATRSPTQ